MKRYLKKIIALAMSGVMAASVFAGIPAGKVNAAADSVKEVSAGGYHSAAIRTDGSLWIWGENGSGQIGDGTKIDRKRPQKIMDNAKTAALGYEHSAVIKSDGSLWMWGENGSGQIGDGTTTDRKQPQKIMEDVKAVSLGREHSAAIKNDGSLWMWGDNYVAQLGDGSMTNRLKPRKVMDNVKSVALGEFYSAAIKTDGSLWMWGLNWYGQLGDGTMTDRLQPKKILTNVKGVAVGGNHTAAIKTDGSLWMWGSSLTVENTNTAPKKMLSNVEKVTVGKDHSAVIKTDGSLWMWGRNLYGQIGDGSTEERTSPKNVKVRRIEQKITASSKTVTIAASPFNINAKASGGGKLSYKSENTKVATVSSTGKITVRGYGKTTIKITAALTRGYLQATKKITIKVLPKKITWDYVKAIGSGRVKIDWKKLSTVTGYECQTSLSSKFSTNTKYHTRKNTYAKSVTVPVVVKGFKKGKTYYVRVRAYKIVNGKKYDGAWSAVKKVTVK